jgi:hypothetical protein
MQRQRNLYHDSDARALAVYEARTIYAGQTFESAKNVTRSFGLWRLCSRRTDTKR